MQEGSVLEPTDLRLRGPTLETIVLEYLKLPDEFVNEHSVIPRNHEIRGVIIWKYFIDKLPDGMYWIIGKNIFLEYRKRGRELTFSSQKPEAHASHLTSRILTHLHKPAYKNLCIWFYDGESRATFVPVEEDLKKLGVEVSELKDVPCALIGFTYRSKDNLLKQVPISSQGEFKQQQGKVRRRYSKYGNDPLAYYQQHFPGKTRGQVQLLDHGLYNRLWRKGLLAHVPTADMRKSTSIKPSQPYR